MLQQLCCVVLACMLISVRRTCASLRCTLYGCRWSFFWHVRARARQSHKFFSMNTCWLRRHRCTLIIFNTNEFNYGPFCQRFAIVHAGSLAWLSGAPKWNGCHSRQLCPLSEEKCASLAGTCDEKAINARWTVRCIFQRWL